MRIPKGDFSDSFGGPADGSGVDTLVALHDRLLAEMPEGATHDEDTCPLCAEELDDGGTHEEEEGGSMSERTFTEAEVQAAVDKAVAEATSALQTKLAELESSHQQSALDQAVADAKAELEVQIADLQTKLDAAVLEASQAKEAKESLEKETQEKEEADRLAKETAARKDERIAKVKEVASFPDEYLEQNGDRFAAMSDEDFAARIEEWSAIAARGNGNGEGGVPAKTAFTASRTEGEGESALSAMREFRRVGIDPRTL